MGGLLRARRPQGFDRVYSSPLRRARQTAALAGFADPTLTDLLWEYDYGAYEGRTSAEIQAGRPGWEIFRDGCPEGESPAQVYARAEEFLKTACKGLGETQAAVAFAHGHILRTVAAAFLGLDVARAAQLPFDTSAIGILRENERGHLLALWNLSQL